MPPNTSHNAASFGPAMMKCQIRVPSNGSIDANAGRTAMDRQLRGDYCIPHRHLFERQNNRRLAAAASMCAQCHQNLNSKQASGTKNNKRERENEMQHSLMSATFFSGAPSRSFSLDWIVRNVTAASVFLLRCN